MTNAVQHTFRVVPIFNPKVGVPAGVAHLRFGNLNPFAIALQFQPSQALLTWFKWVQLRGHFQHAGLMRVDRKGDDLITRHVHRRGARPSPSSLQLGFCADALRPPLAGRESLKVFKIRTEWLDSLPGCKKIRSESQRSYPGSSNLDRSSSIDFHCSIKTSGQLGQI